jgi:hypothetical protein
VLQKPRPAAFTVLILLSPKVPEHLPNSVEYRAEAV